MFDGIKSWFREDEADTVAELGANEDMIGERKKEDMTQREMDEAKKRVMREARPEEKLD